MSVKNTQLEIMQRKLAQHQQHEQRGLLLLKLGFLLTFLLYLLFNQHLYLGDALSWSAYFKDAASLFGFAFTVSIVVLMALFLSWVKHHAYLHFGFFGSVALVVSTVIGFALFAEFFSSSANQDVKASVLLERNSAYQATLTNEGSSSSAVNTGLITSIANAEQKLARCEENLKAGKEKHCNGDRAKVEALRNSEQSANKAHAEANIERDKLKYERQDELKAQSYNPVILTLARFLAGETGDYKDYLKTAVVLITLFVAVCFEILHHFLSKTHGASARAIEDLELGIAKYSAQPEPLPSSSSVQLSTPSPEPHKQPIGFGFPSTAPRTAQAEVKPVLFKYQVQAEPKQTPGRNPIGFTFPTVAKLPRPQPRPASLGTQEEQLTLPDFSGFKARRDTWANPLPDCERTLAHTSPSECVRTLIHTPNNSLYEEWLLAVRADEVVVSAKGKQERVRTKRGTRVWIQKRICPNQQGVESNHLKHVAVLSDSFFVKAESRGIFAKRENYKQGQRNLYYYVEVTP